MAWGCLCVRNEIDEAPCRVPGVRSRPLNENVTAGHRESALEHPIGRPFWCTGSNLRMMTIVAAGVIILKHSLAGDNPAYGSRPDICVGDAGSIVNEYGKRYRSVPPPPLPLPRDGHCRGNQLVLREEHCPVSLGDEYVDGLTVQCMCHWSSLTV